jgi:hypothetical protein
VDGRAGNGAPLCSQSAKRIYLRDPLLSKKRLQQPLGGDRRPPFGRVHSAKLAVESGKNLVDDAADQSQRMVRGRSLFEVDIGAT